MKDASGNPTGLMLAEPNAVVLYSALAKGPKLPYEYQVKLKANPAARSGRPVPA